WRAVPGGSEEGGLDELVEFIASRASSSSTLASSSWTRVSSATRAARTAGERVSPAASSSWTMLMARGSPHIQDQTVTGAERLRQLQGLRHAQGLAPTEARGHRGGALHGREVDG